MPYFILVLVFGLGTSMIRVMIPTYTPEDALKVIRVNKLCTARLADEFLSMRELHRAILPSLTVNDTIRDVAYDILRDGIKISLEDAINVVHHSIVELEVA